MKREIRNEGQLATFLACISGWGSIFLEEGKAWDGVQERGH